MGASEGRAASKLPVADGLSVVIPAYNAAGTIAATIETLRQELAAIATRWEFVVVDDGSTDDTARIVEGLGASDVRLCRSPVNEGKGRAVYRGVCHSRHEAVCFTDADLPFSRSSYGTVARRVLAGAPFVVASRRLPHSELTLRMEVAGYALRRHVYGSAFNHLVRWGLGLAVRDTQCGLKGFSRTVGLELLGRMRNSRFLFDIELFVSARALGVSIEEVPVGVAYRSRHSSVRPARDGLQVLRDLLAIRQRAGRGEYRRPEPSLVALREAIEGTSTSPPSA